MTPEDHRKSLEASARFREAFLKRRIEAAARGHSATPVPTTRMYVLEDPDKFAPGDVVVEDGKRRRMLIKKIVTGFAECIVSVAPIRCEIIHTSMLTLDKDQRWIVHRV